MNAERVLGTKLYLSAWYKIIFVEFILMKTKFVFQYFKQIVASGSGYEADVEGAIWTI